MFISVIFCFRYAILKSLKGADVSFGIEIPFSIVTLQKTFVIRLQRNGELAVFFFIREYLTTLLCLCDRLLCYYFFLKLIAVIANKKCFLCFNIIFQLT